MTTPIDLRAYAWTRRVSDAWTTQEFRALFIAFLQDFTASHSWTKKGAWRVYERFTSTVAEARGLGVSTVEARVARKPPVQPADLSNFQLRTGIRILQLEVVRTRDERLMCVALSFPLGNDTPTATIDLLLDRAAASLEEENRRAPVGG